MDCDRLDEIIEALAEGEPASPAEDAHLAGCARCQARLRLARALDRTLALREVPAPSPDFTSGVMRRVSQERWRAEQIMDVGFNLALAAGLILVAGGLMSLAWSFGWLTGDPPTVAALAPAVRPWLAQAMAEGRTVLTAALLLSSALALWWWVEGDATL